MKMLKNSLNWFEIPAVDFERARSFYSKIYDFDMPVDKIGDIDMGFFLVEQGGIGGAIAYGEGYTPSQTGSTIYLNGGDNLQVILDRVEAAGGQVVVPKFEINAEVGHCAFFIDTEGNKVGLHSMN